MVSTKVAGTLFDYFSSTFVVSTHIKNESTRLNFVYLLVFIQLLSQLLYGFGHGSSSKRESYILVCDICPGCLSGRYLYTYLPVSRRISGAVGTNHVDVHSATRWSFLRSTLHLASLKDTECKSVLYYLGRDTYYT